MRHQYGPHPYVPAGPVRDSSAGRYQLCRDCTGTPEARYTDGRPVHALSPFTRRALAAELPAKVVR
jgi:hypothetical protein